MCWQTVFHTDTPSGARSTVHEKWMWLLVFRLMEWRAAALWWRWWGIKEKKKQPSFITSLVSLWIFPSARSAADGVTCFGLFGKCQCLFLGCRKSQASINQSCRSMSEANRRKVGENRGWMFDKVSPRSAPPSASLSLSVSVSVKAVNN